MGLPAAVLQRSEPSLEIYLSEGLPVRLDVRTGQAVGLSDGFGGWDAVVLQRPMAFWQVLCLRECRALGIWTVVEIDDDFESLHFLTPAFFSTHPKISGPEWNRNWLKVACAEADFVVASTQALADRYAQHGRVVVIPNYVQKSWLEISPVRSERTTVGWSGTVGTHQGDLLVTRGGVAQAVRETGARFLVIGNSELVRRDLSLDEDPESYSWQSWEDYPHRVAELDVGIAPLAQTAFNRSKTALKPLEYAALGVPSVISPLPAYEALAGCGIGILARDRARDWRREVRRLVEDDAYRSELSVRGREVAAKYTIEANAWRFAEAWTASPVVVR